MVMVDTDILSGIMKGNEDLLARFFETCHLSKGRLYVTPIQTAEIFLATRDEETFIIKNFLDSLCVIPITQPIAILAASYQKEYGKSHPIQLTDSLIAAAVLGHTLKLWTGSPKRYPMIPQEKFWRT